MSQARATPFLYVYDELRVFLMLLAPAPHSVVSGRVSVTSVLSEHLHDIEVVREQIDSIARLVDHRYDRLFAALEG